MPLYQGSTNFLEIREPAKKVSDFKFPDDFCQKVAFVFSSYISTSDNIDGSLEAEKRTVFLPACKES